VPSATAVIAVFLRAGSNAVASLSVGSGPAADRSRANSGFDSHRAGIRPSASIVTSVKDVQTTLYVAFGLVVLVIFIFLGRASDTLIPAVALPSRC